MWNGMPQFSCMDSILSKGVSFVIFLTHFVLIVVPILFIYYINIMIIDITAIEAIAAFCWLSFLCWDYLLLQSFQLSLPRFFIQAWNLFVIVILAVPATNDSTIMLALSLLFYHFLLSWASSLVHLVCCSLLYFHEMVLKSRLIRFWCLAITQNVYVCTIYILVKLICRVRMAVLYVR